jgi:hypothetical protein
VLFAVHVSAAAPPRPTARQLFQDPKGDVEPFSSGPADGLPWPTGSRSPWVRRGGRRGSRRSYRRERRRWLGRHLLIQRFSRTRVGGVSTHSGASSPVRYRTESTNVHRFTTMRSFITTAKDGRVSHGSGRRHRLRQLVNHIASDQGRVPAGPLRTAWSGHGPGGSDGSPVRGPPCALRAHIIGVLRRASIGRGFAPNAWRDRVRLG